MIVCKNCKEELTIEQSENNRAFPAYTVIGGLFGTLGAAVTGTLLLIPATVVAGAFADSSTRRCGICGSESEEDGPGYHLMEELGDELSGRTYRPVGKSNPDTQQLPQQSDSRQRQQSFQPTQRMHENGRSCWKGKNGRIIPDEDIWDYCFECGNPLIVGMEESKDWFDIHNAGEAFPICRGCKEEAEESGLKNEDCSGHVCNSDSLNPSEQFDDQQKQCEFVFDETEGKLVQQRQSSEENRDDVSLSNGFDNEFTVGFEAPQGFEIEDGIGTGLTDPFSDFQADSSLDVNPFGPIDEPPIGEL